jgi:hypothetical protein
VEFVDLQRFYERKFFSREFAQRRPLAQRALVAGRVTVWSSVSHNHGRLSAGSDPTALRKAKQIAVYANKHEFSPRMSFLNAARFNP